MLQNSYFTKSEISFGLPNYFVIESTNFCNLKCIMCPYSSMTRKKEHMDWLLYKNIIDQIYTFADFVWLHMFSEPLLNPKIFDMIKYAKEKKIRIGLSTNATLLNKFNSLALLESNPDILIISMDGTSKETYEKIRVGSDFNKVSKNISEFDVLQKKFRRNTKTVLQIIKMKRTEIEIDDFVEKWKSSSFTKIKVKNLHSYASQINLKEIRRINRDKNEKICYEPWLGMSILSNGNVVPCCNDYDSQMILGNLKKEKVLEVWNSFKMRNFRNTFLGDYDKRNKICKSCNVPCTNKDIINEKNPFRSYEYQLKNYVY